MFKQYFVDLVNVSSAVSLQRLVAGLPKIKLSTHTVLLYHKLFGTGKYEAGVRERKKI